MADYNLKISTKIPSDMNELDDANSTMRLSVRSKTQLTAEQDKQKSIANLAAILSLIDTQICLEKDSEILTYLKNQKANLNELLIQKQSGKKDNFKTAENKAISELQSQFSNLEKSVDKKFNTILQSIENSQSTVNSWTQIASQNAQKFQNEQQQHQTVKTVSKQAQSQSSKQVQKQTQEQKQKQKQELTNFQSRKLIVHVKAEI